MIRFGRRARRGARTGILALGFGVALGGCSSPDEGDRQSPAILLTGETRPAPKAPAAAKIEAVERIPAASPGTVVPHRDFQDPPLPPELRADGGLAPLPPRPRPSEMVGEMQPTFQAPQ